MGLFFFTFFISWLGFMFGYWYHDYEQKHPDKKD